MNLERIEEYADGSEFDRAFLSEVAKRVDALWGGLRIEAAAGAAVGTLFHTTLIFRDGFKVNHSSDLNTFLGVNGAAAVIAAVWDWMGLGWLEMLARYRPTRGCSAPPAALYMELHALALRHPSIVLVDDDPARWPRWQAPEEPPATESKAARRRRRRRLALPGGLWRLFAQKDSGPVQLENQGALQELVVGQWLHVEQVAEREFWMRVGDMRVRVEVSRFGSAEVSVERGFYGTVLGDTDVGSE